MNLNWTETLAGWESELTGICTFHVVRLDDLGKCDLFIHGLGRDHFPFKQLESPWKCKLFADRMAWVLSESHRIGQVGAA